MRLSLSTTVPRISDIVRRKQAQKFHWVTDWLKLSVIFQKKKSLNMVVYSFFQKFCPLIQWYAGDIRKKLFLEFQQPQRITS